ncbi:MAG: hypothetical protein LKE46_04780 [Clostridium sp.]|uniref:hypothetical protein n=1 Tax=Clostridium sp. TaxID=1506 RepID=UPI0025B96CAE|nr:hypothetical protein [Clostridium sp.]MCH3963564.1 hypothetical protein [Clostridium sp.]MCI1714705.1 hypothetical protein [Clostridium sp.]MCI1799106.1 hypothetical protein [Clostridium sp.]MCI1812888.1 hypothetical protein [Clostridium sp.]MCI1869778.1 hypothetical protein [Clostridium sp.]
MNCHKNNNKTNHMLIMVICCAVPLILAAALPFLGMAPGLKTILASAAPFLCPIMMILMMPMMFMHSRKDKDNGDNNIKKIND